MCTTSWTTNGDCIAATGSMSTSRPPSTRNPRGAFIHALTMTTNTADARPDAATPMPATMCQAGRTRSQP